MPLHMNKRTFVAILSRKPQFNFPKMRGGSKAVWNSENSSVLEGESFPYCWLINISPQLLWNVSLGLGKSRPFQSDEGGFSFKEGKIVKEIIITFVNSSLSGTWQYPEHSQCETGEPPPCLQPVLFHKSKVEYWNIWQKQTKERKKPLCWQKGVATFLGHIGDLSLVY